MKTWIQRFIFFILIFLCSILLLQEYQNYFAQRFKDRLGEQFPKLQEVVWLDQKAPQKELPTLYIRWEVWCPACLQSIEKNNELAKTYQDRINILGLTTQWDDGVKDLSRRLIQYPVGHDVKQVLDHFFEVQAIPFYALVDGQNKIIYQGNSIEESILKKLL